MRPWLISLLPLRFLTLFCDTNSHFLPLKSMFELIGSEASYLRSLRVAVNHFYASKALKQTLSQTEHHMLFSNIRRVMTASEKWDTQEPLLFCLFVFMLSWHSFSSRFLMDLEIRLGQSVLISQVGDIVFQHCPQFRSLYVPYVINMMYQEALVNQLLWVCLRIFDTSCAP